MRFTDETFNGMNFCLDYVIGFQNTDWNSIDKSNILI